jgi:general L-amino acid transport system permease protein
VLGVARLSSNWLINKAAATYIGFLRNTPLIVFAFFFYFGLILRLPKTSEAIEFGLNFTLPILNVPIHLPGLAFLSNRGVYTIWGTPTESFTWWIFAVAAGAASAIVLRIVLSRRQQRTGQRSYSIVAPLLALVLIPSIGWFVGGAAPLVADFPKLVGTNFRGGLRLTPEYFSIVAVLTLYIATYIGEIVRAGIQSVDRGQLDAARAVGLTQTNIFWHVVMPQALRVIVPPTISQYINLTKGTALAIVVGFSDVFVVTRNIIEQSGRSVPMFLLLIVAYLLIAVVYAIVGNIYNYRTRIVER